MFLAYLALAGRIILLGAERIILKKLGTNSDSLCSTFLFFAIAVFLLFPFIFFYKVSSFTFIYYALLSGFIYSIAFIFYTRSLSTEEVSLVGPLYNFNVLFLLIMTTLILNESFKLTKLVGIFILIYGARFLNNQENIWLSLKSIIENKSCQMMIAASLLIAAGRIVDALNIHHIPPLIYAFTLYVIVSIYLLIYILFTGKMAHVKELIRTKPLLSFASGFTNAYSYVFLLIAFTQIEISIAEPASMLGMIITVILSKIFFKEVIRDRFIGVIIMVAGAWFLFI